MDASLEASFDAHSEHKERLRRVFIALSSQKAPLVKIGVSWKDVDDHFQEIERSLRRSFDEYKAKEEAFQSRMQQVHAALEQREAELSAREDASLSRVQERKDAAVATIIEQKRKWSAEKKTRLGAAVGVESAKAASNKSPSKNCAAVKEDSNEQTMVTGVKAAVKENRYEQAMVTGVNVNSTLKDECEEAEPHIDPRPELRELCVHMDAEGLLKFLVSLRKDIKAMYYELPAALTCSKDPSQLVLQALEGFLSMTASDKASEKVHRFHRRACLHLLQSLLDILKGHHNLPLNLKKVAKDFFDTWKLSVKWEENTEFRTAAEAHNYLELLGKCGLASYYDQDELCDLVVKIARRNYTPPVLKALGLSSKAPEVIERLIKDGKRLEALSFACTFEHFECCHPVDLLKAHLNEAREAATALIKRGDKGAQNDARKMELAAAKRVLNAITENKLESQFSLDYVKAKIAKLEKSLPEGKRPATDAKTQSLPKQSRTNGSPFTGDCRAVSGSPQKSQIDVSNWSHNVSGLSLEKSIMQSGFDNHILGGYGSSYDRISDSASSALYSLGGLSTYSSLVSPISYSGYDYSSALSSLPGSYRPYL